MQKQLNEANLTIDKFLSPKVDNAETTAKGELVFQKPVKPKMGQIGKLMKRTLIGDHDQYQKGQAYRQERKQQEELQRKLQAIKYKSPGLRSIVPESPRESIIESPKEF